MTIVSVKKKTGFRFRSQVKRPSQGATALIIFSWKSWNFYLCFENGLLKSYTHWPHERTWHFFQDTLRLVSIHLWRAGIQWLNIDGGYLPNIDASSRSRYGGQSVQREKRPMAECLVVRTHSSSLNTPTHTFPTATTSLKSAHSL